MVAVQIGGRQRLVVGGTPGYFSRHGRPRQPKDLLTHRCVVHSRAGGEAYRWEFEKGGRERQVAVIGALFENDPRIAELAVLTGQVIAFAFEAQMASHLARGTLETVLDDWCPPFPGFHLYYPSRREVTPALRAPRRRKAVAVAAGLGLRQLEAVARSASLRGGPVHALGHGKGCATHCSPPASGPTRRSSQGRSRSEGR